AKVEGRGSFLCVCWVVFVFVCVCVCFCVGVEGQERANECVCVFLCVYVCAHGKAGGQDEAAASARHPSLLPLHTCLLITALLSSRGVEVWRCSRQAGRQVSGAGGEWRWYK